LLWRFSSDLNLLEEERKKSSGWRPANLRKHGFSPRTVVDVGAAHGTPHLYGAYPDAHHVLVEPLRECEESLKWWVGKQGGEYLLAAIGDREGHVALHVDKDRHWASSVLPPAGPSTDGSAEERTVPITTLDRLYEERGWPAPFGLKIDTEGFEDRVIEGATRLLLETEFVIAEVSVAQRFEGSYSFADFIALMKSAGFRLADILDGLKSSHSGEVIFIDALFRRLQP
jgi:FkbM family methyltransferase